MTTSLKWQGPGLRMRPWRAEASSAPGGAVVRGRNAWIISATVELGEFPCYLKYVHTSISVKQKTVSVYQFIHNMGNIWQYHAISICLYMVPLQISGIHENLPWALPRISPRCADAANQETSPQANAEFVASRGSACRGSEGCSGEQYVKKIIIHEWDECMLTLRWLKCKQFFTHLVKPW